MGIVVQKYGGSSVADVEKLRKVARKVKERVASGQQVVVVVSAMGDTTDELLALAKSVSPDPPRRELDMLLTCGERISMALLSMALQHEQVSAISFTGSQSGIITTDAHSQARIIEVRPYRIQDELAAGKVVIVAGYQGVSYRREVTTLGRGGSDTTAVALAAALGADCEIYSDVDGVFSADPRVVPDAKKLSALSYDEMQELSAAGAKVLNAQAVEFARAKGIVILAKSAHSAGEGTAVIEAPTGSSPVRGVTSDSDVLALGTKGDARLLAELLEFLEARGAASRLVSFNESRGGAFLVVPLQDVHGVEALKADLAVRFTERVQVHGELGTVTCVGTGLHTHGAILRRALGCAESLHAPVAALHASPLQLSMLVQKTQLPELTRRLHEELVRV